MLATAKQDFFSWGVKIRIYDSDNSLLGSIEEKVFESLFKVETSYSISDASGMLIGESEKSNWLATDFSVKDNQGNEIASMHRPAFDLGAATWTFNLNDTGAIDKRMCVFMPAFKTKADNQRSSSSSSSSSK